MRVCRLHLVHRSLIPLVVFVLCLLSNPGLLAQTNDAGGAGQPAPPEEITDTGVASEGEMEFEPMTEEEMATEESIAVADEEPAETIKLPAKPKKPFVTWIPTLVLTVFVLAAAVYFILTWIKSRMYERNMEPWRPSERMRRKTTL